MNYNKQQTALHIHYDVPLPALFFPSVISAFFAGCYHFYTVGINNRVAWTLLTSSISSRLFYKMLQDFVARI